jgi:hypothetical protein
MEIIQHGIFLEKFIEVSTDPSGFQRDWVSLREKIGFEGRKMEDSEI